MELTGTVLNVVDFGCFVDIGMHDSGLVHVSRLADRYIRDPHDVVAVGDIVRVWVMEVDKERRRVSLTMVRPGTERAKQPHHGSKPERVERPSGEGAAPRGEGRIARRPPHKAATGGRDSSAPRPHGRGRPQHEPYRPPPRPRPAPKPLIPITDSMKAGKEPMRTFGDLLQFYQHKTVAPADNQPPAAAAETPAKEETPAVVEEARATVDETPAAQDGQSV